MVAKKSKLAITEDGIINQAYQKYQLLKKEVDRWHQERGSHWLNLLSLAENPPYLPVLELPSEAIIELWQRLNVAAEVKSSDSELREIWEEFSKGQTTIDSVMNEEMATRFQLAINGVAQLASKLANEKGLPAQGFGYKLPDDPHDGIACPVCGEVVELAVLTPPEGKRIMHCNVCCFEWRVNRVGCLYCGSQDAKQQMFLNNEAFPGVEMMVCQLCGHYFKEIDARVLSTSDYLWEDLRTIPLNFAIEHWLSEQAKKNDYKKIN